MVTRRRTSTTRRRTTSTTRRRRTTSASTTRRRRTPRTSTTLGSVAALALVAVFTQASWPVRVGLIFTALMVVVLYLVLRALRTADDAAREPIAPQPEPPVPSDDKEPQP